MPILSRVILLSGVVFACLPVAAQLPMYRAKEVQVRTLYMEDPQKWLTPKFIYPPEFPQEQLLANATGEVDVEVSIDEMGRIMAARVLKSTPVNKAFESAVMKALPRWFYYRRIDESCTPVKAVATTRIWFEIRDGKGVVSVSGRLLDEPAGPDVSGVANMLNREEVYRSMPYPSRAGNDGAQAELVAAIDVDAATGNVTNVEVTWIEMYGGRSVGAEERFRLSTITGLTKGKFAPRAGPPYRVCAQHSYRFQVPINRVN